MCRLCKGWAGSRVLFQSQFISDRHQLSPHRHNGLTLKLAGRHPPTGQHESQETYSTKFLLGVRFHLILYPFIPFGCRRDKKLHRPLTLLYFLQFTLTYVLCPSSHLINMSRMKLSKLHYALPNPTTALKPSFFFKKLFLKWFSTVSRGSAGIQPYVFVSRDGCCT